MDTKSLSLFALIALAPLTGQAAADDWNVTRLRGQVMQQVDGTWLPLLRNDVVPDDRRIHTTNNGYVTLARGNEVLELGPSSQVRIFDEGGRKPYTTVLQSWGTVTVEAEVRNVEHFAVQNQYLAAVVKGTRFVVSATSTGAAVDVERGHVSVGNSESNTIVAAGQQANVSAQGTMSVSGEGELPPVLFAVSNSDESAAAVNEALPVLDVAVDRHKAAEKAAKAAEKAVEKAARDQARAPEKAAKAAAKAAEEAPKAAEKNKKGSGDNSGKGKGSSSDGDDGKGKKGKG